MLKRLIVACVLLMAIMVVSAQEELNIDIANTTLEVQASGWLVQMDVDGYYAVLNSSEGMFDFMFGNQYVPEGEAVVAITDQTQLDATSRGTSGATSAEELASELAASFSYAVDMPPEAISLGDKTVYRLRINFGTLQQYAYLADVEGLLVILYLFTSNSDMPVPHEDAIGTLYESMVVSGEIMEAEDESEPSPDYFARALSNGDWVFYGTDDGWIASSEPPDYHRLRLDRRDDASGRLSLSFITPEFYGDVVFGQPDATSIINTAKGYNPPYDPPESTSDAAVITIGENTATLIEFVYPEQVEAYYLFEAAHGPLLVIVRFERNFKEVQQAYVDPILSQLNTDAVDGTMIRFAVPIYEITTSTETEMISFEIGYSQFSPYASIGLFSEGLTELFGIQMESGIESVTYDLSGNELNVNYNIEVRLDNDQLAYANYRANRKGALVFESNGYTASGSVDFSADFSGFVDPYTAAPLEGTAQADIPKSVSISVTFSDMEIAGLEYMR